MRIIKILCFLFLLSSCNKYLGVVEPDYNPTDELKDIYTRASLFRPKKLL